MNTTLKVVLGVLAGLIVGSIVNMSLISVSSSVIPLPEGVNPEDMESLKANMHLFEAKHFIFPFLAHALGTLAGALLAVKIASEKSLVAAMVVGGFFLLGGIMSTFMLPAPAWFSILDIVVAYIPMAILANKMLGKASHSS